MLRHTMATTLLANGCPIGHIHVLLGHEHLGTTCRYYLGTMSDAEAKAAHAKLGKRLPPTMPQLYQAERRRKEWRFYGREQTKECDADSSTKEIEKLVFAGFFVAHLQVMLLSICQVYH